LLILKLVKLIEIYINLSKIYIKKKKTRRRRRRSRENMDYSYAKMKATQQNKLASCIVWRAKASRG
jgi:hypothetical protein